MTKMVPDIRFEGFDGEWVRDKIGDICDVVAGGDIDRSNLKDKGRYPVIGNSVGKNDSIIGYYNDYYRIEAPAVTVTGRGEIGTPIARFENFTPVVRLIALKFDSSFNVNFMENSLRKIKVFNETTGVPQLTATAFKKYNINFTNYEEQEKIGGLFEALDDLIEGQGEVVDRSKDLKKAFLQKLFPKEGASQPEVRFPGFDGDWKIKKMNSLVEIKRGLTYKPKDICDEGVRVLRSSNIDKDSFIVSDSDVFVKKSVVNIDYAKKGDILITAANGSPKLVGKHAVIDEINSPTVHGGFMFLVKTDYPYFLDTYLHASWYKKFIHISSTGGNGSIGNLKIKDLNSIKIPFPSLAEQEKIGSFFKSLDEKIEREEAKLNSYKKLKKSLLQKMFV